MHKSSNTECYNWRDALDEICFIKNKFHEWMNVRYVAQYMHNEMLHNIKNVCSPKWRVLWSSGAMWHFCIYTYIWLCLHLNLHIPYYLCPVVHCLEHSMFIKPILNSITVKQACTEQWLWTRRESIIPHKQCGCLPSQQSFWDGNLQHFQHTLLRSKLRIPCVLVAPWYIRIYASLSSDLSSTSKCMSCLCNEKLIGALSKRILAHNWTQLTFVNSIF